MIRLSPDSGVPVYRQICDQIKQMILAGRLPAGRRLDSVRALAARLKVNALTVAKAYHRLAAEGVVAARPSKGVFVAVAGGGSPLSHNARLRVLGRLLDQVVAESYQLDIAPEEAVNLLGEKFAAAEPPSTPGGGEPSAGQTAAPTAPVRGGTPSPADDDEAAML